MVTQVSNKLHPGDTILFYYAGHGAFRDNDSYLILPNTSDGNFSKTALPLRDISTILRNPSVINVRIFDSCHSGHDVRAADEAKLNFENFSRDIMSGSSEGWLTFAGCKSNEFSYADHNFEHGVFTKYLVDGILNTHEGDHIYPEKLKLDTCNFVKQWCDDHNKQQTPTFNSAISGNISIASRITKSKKLTPEKRKEESLNIDISTERTTLEEQLKKLRTVPRIGDDSHHKILLDSIITASSIFSELIEKVNTYGLEIKNPNQMKADDMPQAVKALIVPQIRNSKLRTIHKIDTEREYEKQDPLYSNLMSSIAFFAPKPKLISVTHKIEQSFSWPDSYTQINFVTDGYIPDCILFLYISPLLTSVGIFTGYIIDYGDGSIKEEQLSKLFGPYVTLLEKNSLNECIKDNLDLLIKDFNASYYNVVKKRVGYLEWELKQAHNTNA
ncbi:caspase family protein [bacterium]|nr:caspase family protein [bacterium]